MTQVLPNRLWGSAWLLGLSLAAMACGDGIDPGAGTDGGPGEGPDGSVSCPAAAPAPRERPRFGLEAPAAIRRFGGGPIALPRSASGPLHRVESGAPERGGRLLAEGPARTRMEILLMSATGEDPAFSAARAALERVGVPYRAYIAEEEDELVAADLIDDEGTCRYHGVILSQAYLEHYDPELDEYASALTPSEWFTLADFELTCGAREVVWYAWPSEDLGLEQVAEFPETERVETTLTAEGEAIFPYIQDGARIAIEEAYGYRTSVLDTAATVPLLTTDAGDALAVLHERADGREVLVMTMDSAPYNRHAQLLEYGVLSWLSRGLHLGHRRVYLAPHIDDVFLSTFMWVPGEGDSDTVTYRMTAGDAEWVADWQARIQEQMPAGSELTTYLAFNGEGSEPSSYPDSSLVETLRARKGDFGWINHTWDHLNMDAMVKEKARLEMAQNCQLAETWSMPGFACTDAVTPEISGLDNPEAVAGMIEAGVRYVVSDTSVTEEDNPENPGTNPSHNVGRVNPHDSRLYQVPRHPTNIFYNTSTPEEQVDLYNTAVGDEDFGGREFTYDEVLEQEAKIALHHLLAYDLNPYMFHQANLRTFVGEDGEVHTLYTDWVERVLARYVELVELPIRSPTIRETAALMMERSAYDQCGVEAVLVEDESGRRLELSGAAECTVPVTGVDVPERGQVDAYGGVPTTFVPLDGCETVSVPLEG